MDTKTQLQEVKDRLTQLDPNNRDNLVQIATLRQQEIQLQQQIVVDEQNQAAAQLRIQDATEKAAYLVDSMDIEGLTMRDLTIGEKEYQVLRISVQNQFINQAEEFCKQIAEIQAAENEQQARLKQQLDELQAKFDEDTKQVNVDQETIASLRAQLAQSQSETKDYIGKLKNATDEIERLESQVDDLRKEIAVGARNAYKVIDSEEQGKQLKALADQIKASRIHVYDVEPDNAINPKNYTATRADNGEPVTYNWTQAKNYIEIKDPNEVEQFRQHFANQEAVSDSPLGNEEVVDVTPEVVFPELPSAIAPEVPTLPNTVDQGQQNGEVSATNAGQSQTFEERLSALEAHCFGYVKQAVA